MKPLRIKDVAEQTGMTTFAIRQWETRHGWPKPARTSNNYRVYAPEIVEHIQAVKARVAEGHHVADAILIVTDSHKPKRKKP